VTTKFAAEPLRAAVDTRTGATLTYAYQQYRSLQQFFRWLAAEWS
jgi:hypothetical protein